MSYFGTTNYRLQVARGLIPNASIVAKSGLNPNVTSGSAPEDMWNGSAVYSGFPTSAPEVVQFFSSSASDTGVLTYQYLATSTSTQWQQATVTLNGTTPVSGVSVYRIHTARYSSGSATGFNVGTITGRHSVTTANVFFAMPIGRSQTYVACYTVPFGSTAYLMDLFASVAGTGSVAYELALWIRPLNGSPRIRRNFTASNSFEYFFNEDGSVELLGGTDIALRILSSTSGSGMALRGGFDLIEFTS